MMNKLILASAAAALLMPAAPALADPPPWAPAHGARAHRGDDGRYDRNGRYRTPQRINSDTRVWRGEDGRYYCRRDNGTTGLIVGAAAGALIGREIDSRGDRTVGTILGAAGGALLGREIDRAGGRCR